MSLVDDLPSTVPNLADLLNRLGDISPQRILVPPALGAATEADVVAMLANCGRLCELVEGALVEKPMGYEESLLSVFLATALSNFVNPRRLGLVSGEAGMVRLFPGLVRIPDVAYTSWSRFPGGRLPRVPIPDLVPDLAVEILSLGNTAAEMDRKLQDYFSYGVRLVWIIDPDRRRAAVYTAADSHTELDATQTLDGGEVLPGFQLALADLFAILDQHG